MHLLFLDESGRPSDRMFALGGVAIRVSEWEAVRDQWEAVLSDSGWPLDKELKWSGTRSGEVPPATADSIYAAVAQMPVTCFVTVLKPLAGRKAYEALFSDDDETYSTALTFIAERFQRFLARENSYGAIVLDSRRREVDDRMRRFFDRLQREGTPYAQLDRLVDSLLLGPSHFSLGLQLADLIVGSALAAQRGPSDGSRWHKQLLPRFARHPDTGEVDGVGLKVFPDKVTMDEPAVSKLFELR